MPPGLRRRHTSQEAALRRVIITRGGRRVTAQGSWASTLGAVSGGHGVWRGEGRVPPGPHGAHGQPGSPTAPHGPSAQPRARPMHRPPWSRERGLSLGRGGGGETTCGHPCFPPSGPVVPAHQALAGGPPCSRDRDSMARPSRKEHGNFVDGRKVLLAQDFQNLKI